MGVELLNLPFISKMKSKFILHIILAFSLTGALLAPSVISIIDGEFDNVYMLNINEEEQKSENEKNIDKNTLFFEFFSSHAFITIALRNNAEQMGHENYSTMAFEIISPPPEVTMA